LIPLFQKAGLRFLFTHPWQTGLSVLGIALGVGIILSIDIANESSTRAFDISMETVTGKASHRIESKSGDISIRHLAALRLLGLDATAPVIEQNVKIKGKEQITATFLGLDPFSESGFRDFIDIKKENSGDLLPRLLDSRNSVFVPASFAKFASIRSGDSLEIEWQGKSFVVYVAAILPGNNGEAGSVDQFMISDIETARVLFNTGDKVSYIDLILDSGYTSAVHKYLEANRDIELKSTTRTNDTARSMTEAFRLNLNAMSMLGLVVGLFLINRCPGNRDVRL